MIYPVILCGGSGTRLWPLSQPALPKPFLSLSHNKTLLQKTLLRTQGWDEVAPPVITTYVEHRFLVAEQVRQLELTPHWIMLEPCRRNTAPAVTAAAVKVLMQDPNALLFISPTDIEIQHLESLKLAVVQGVPWAQDNHIVTFGVVPGHPHTGYGYIQKGNSLDKKGTLFHVSRFVEKPDKASAQIFLDSGQYLWNSGMFLLRASLLVSELQHYHPELVEACQQAVAKGITDTDFFKLDPDAFSQCPDLSLDYAMMERTRQAVVIETDLGWTDLGCWSALWTMGQKDANGNVIHGKVIMHDVKNTYIHTTSGLVAAVGVEDLIIVETGEALLVTARNKEQQISELIHHMAAPEGRG